MFCLFHFFSIFQGNKANYWLLYIHCAAMLMLCLSFSAFGEILIWKMKEKKWKIATRKNRITGNKNDSISCMKIMLYLYQNSTNWTEWYDDAYTNKHRYSCSGVKKFVEIMLFSPISLLYSFYNFQKLQGFHSPSTSTQVQAGCPAISEAEVPLPSLTQSNCIWTYSYLHEAKQSAHACTRSPGTSTHWMKAKFNCCLFCYLFVSDDKIMFSAFLRHQQKNEDKIEC